jgi:hypothetical protein
LFKNATFRMTSTPLFNWPSLAAFDTVKASMASLGYVGDLFVENYDYQDLATKSNKVNTVDAAGFAQTPTSYRNACVSVVVGNGKVGADLVRSHRSVGSPLCFEITPEKVNRWKVTSDEPELLEVIEHSQIENLFTAHRDDWSPETIFRAKSIGKVEPQTQLDFFDVGLFVLLENQAPEKLDRLLRTTLHEITEEYKQLHDRPSAFRDVFRLVFRFIVAKVMKDRDHLPKAVAHDASQILNFVEDYYGLKNKPILEADNNRDRIIDLAWKQLSSGINFENLSVDDLAFIYEKTLVEETDRKKLGIHSTPPRISEYIVNKLPFEIIPQSKRFVFEPCAGHGGFLVSALRRLRELLPQNWGIGERHKYLVNHLSAIEQDDFALEACWSRLVLADYPHRNGWQLDAGDVFEGDLFTQHLDKANILLCNPPFEKFSPSERRRYKNQGIDVLTWKPAEILRRIFLNPPKLLGLVLPSSFEAGATYLPFHKQLAETYEAVELVSLPEMFNYSDSTTTLVLASAKRERKGRVTVVCRKVREGEDRSNFLHGIEPAGARAEYAVDEYSKSEFSLWEAPLNRVWTWLESNPRMTSITVDIHRGFCWVSQNDKEIKSELILDQPRKGYMKGPARVHGQFLQYSLVSTQYLSRKKEDQYDDAYNHAWEEPKVICNAARLRRSAWRLGAFADCEGLAASQRFTALWLAEGISLFAVTALLNSPLVNAYMYAQENSSANHIRVIKTIPLPNLDCLETGGKLEKMSIDLHKLIERNLAVRAKKKLLEIDALIMREYDLPLDLERELLDIFQHLIRPVPFEFNGYYPDDFEANFPLYEIISNDFDSSRADLLLKRMHFVDDLEISNALARLEGDSEDEEEGLSF